MALESGTFISDLVITNPPGGDQVRQGDDHVRLVKSVLKNTFPNASKPFLLPSSTTKTIDYNVVSGDQNATILVNNGAAMTLTMPALLTTDAGWMIRVVKLNTGFPVFIAPPSGNILSGQATVARARRNVPLVPFTVLWTGSNWLVERCIYAPIGAAIPIFTAALPLGYEWPNGQTLTALDYPEYVALKGSAATPDLRQRTVFGTNLGGADPGRITSVIGPSLENVGGSQFLHQHSHGGITGLQTALHSHTFSFTTSINNESLDHTHDVGLAVFSSDGGSGFARHAHSGSVTTTGASFGIGSHTHNGGGTTGTEGTNHAHSISLDGAGASQNMPPTIICNYALVVE